MMSTNDLQDVFRTLGIPDTVRQTYAKKGLKQLYDWQRECLVGTNVMRGENLVYCAPTSGGKTLVAELVLLKTVLSLRKKAIFVLPYVSLVMEKEKHLKDVVRIFNSFLQDSANKVKVKAYYGEKKASRRFNESIIVCTIEKANSIVNSLILSKRIGSVGTLILDETHVLGNKMNGYLLELLMAKVLSIKDSEMTTKIQIIALSATMGNVHQLAQWLRAKLYITTFRPIPLVEYIKAGNLLLNSDGVVIDQFDVTAQNKLDPDGIALLCKQGTQKGQQVIVFAPTKAGCGQHCKSLSAADVDFSLVSTQQVDVQPDRLQLIDALRQDNPSCDKVLLDGIVKGVAYHHSGLTLFERVEIEQAFRSGVISILVATTTLAAGVNLPAGRVIIHTLSLGRDSLSVVNYKQMSGRAGRAGQTAYGESFLVVKSMEREKAFHLTKQLMPDIVSQFHPANDGGNAFLRAAVEAIGLGITRSMPQMVAFVENTLLFHQCTEENKVQVRDFVLRSVQFLVDARIVESVSSSPSASPVLGITRFGNAMLQSGMDPDEAILIYESLLAAQNGISLESPLHLLYLITPLDHNLVPNFKRILQLHDSSEKSSQRAVKQSLDAIGICSNLLSTWLVNIPSKHDLDLCTSDIKQTNISHYFAASGSAKATAVGSNKLYLRSLSVTKRFWATLLLLRIVEGCPYEHIAKEFKCDMNEIELLHRNARIFAMKCQRFCEQMGWISMEKLLGHFKGTLETEIPKEMQALLSIPKMTRKIANVLLDNDVHDAASLLKVESDTVARWLRLSVGFEFQDVVSVQQSTGAVLSRDEVIEGRIREMVAAIRDSASECVDEMVSASKSDRFDERHNCESSEDEESDSSSDDEEGSEDGDNRDDEEGEERVVVEQQTVQVWFQKSTQTPLPADNFPSVELPATSKKSEADFQLPEIRQASAPIQGSRFCGVARNSSAEGRHLNVVFMSPAKRTVASADVVECVVSDDDLLRMMEEFESTGMLHREHQNANVNGAHAFTYYPLESADTDASENTSSFDNIAVQALLASKQAIDVSIHSMHSEEVTLPRWTSAEHVPEVCQSQDNVDVEDAMLLAMMDEWERTNTTAPPIDYNRPETCVDLDITRLDEDGDDNHCEQSRLCVSGDKRQDQKRVKFSPYLTPFTASKVKTPGKYFLVDLNERMGCLHVPTAAVSSDQRNGDHSLQILLLDCEQICTSFLQAMQGSSSFAFELVFKSLPLQVLNGSAGRNNHNLSRDSDKLNTWSSLVSLFCSTNAFVTCNASDSSLPDLLSLHHATQKELASSGANVLVGVCITFDGRNCFYVSLPQLLPLRESLLEKAETDSQTVSSWSTLPSHCLELVAAFVGFPKLIVKSPILYDLLSQPVSINTAARITPSPNPMLLACKRWCVASRRSLAAEWRKGGAKEWRLVQQLFSSDTFGKISPNMKSKTIVLRERDVLMAGPVLDPAIARSLLNHARSGVANTTSLIFPSALLQDSESLFVSQARTHMFTSAQRTGVVVASWRATASFIAMQALESELMQHNQYELFHNIEMPLQICIADSELSGIEIHSSKLSKLRQSIRDRQVVIEYYLKNIIDVSFNVDSPSDVARLKASLQKLSPTSVEENATSNCLCANNIVTSDWSAGKQFKPVQESVAQVGVIEHPLMRVISEHRSHSRMIPLLTSVLGARRFARVRPCFNSIGAETGRLILSHPPLQQVPHECRYLPCDRPTLQQEIDQWTEHVKDTSLFLDQLNRKLAVQAADRNQAEWVKVVGESKSSAHKVGKLVRVLPFSIDKQYLTHVNSATFHLQMPTIKTIPNQEFLSKEPLSAVLAYSGSLEEKTLQVLVEFPGGEAIWETCSASMVHRLNAGILPKKEEFQLLSNSYSIHSKNGANFGEATREYDAYFQQLEELVPVRESFVASEGYVFVSADYSQVELRILAHLCEDAGLIEAFEKGKNEGKEVFRFLASQWKKKPMDAITTDERNEIKHLCYGVIYGAGVSRLADTLRVDEGTAQFLCQDFMARFPQIKTFINTVKLRCEADGFSETLFGRKRVLPHIQDKGEMSKLRARAQRQAVNTICQGSAADIIKLAMVNIHRKLEELSLASPLTGKEDIPEMFCFRTLRRNPGGGLYRNLDDARLVLQIHDELVYEVRERDVEKVAFIIKDCMENSVSLKVPLEAKLAVGKDWANLTPFELHMSQTGMSSSFKVVQNLFGNEG